MAKLFIGMPVFNGEKFVEMALKSLCAQSFRDWKLLISDNGSNDRTREICERFAKLDSRIGYIRHDVNRGPAFNFKFVLDQADTDYYMWASSDDEWHPDFILAGMTHLLSSEKYGMAFSNLVNIDSFGREIRSYTDRNRYTSSENKTADIVSFLLEPEILGKANLFYGIYRISVCKEAWRRVSNLMVWGSDCIFNLAVITLCDIKVDERVLFRKRFADPKDKLDSDPIKIVIERPQDGIFPVSHSSEYIDGILNLFTDETLKSLVAEVMGLRLQLVKNIEAGRGLIQTNESYKKQNELLVLKNQELERMVNRVKENKLFKIYDFTRKLF